MTTGTNEENIHSNLREGRVRWDDATVNNEKNSTAAGNSLGDGNVAATSAAATPTTKAKTSNKFSSTKKKFDHDAVAEYHFGGVPNTPWSKKKPKHRHHQKQHDQTEGASQSSIGDRELLQNQNPENTFNLGGNTASLASVYGDMDASMLSTASGASSMASSAASSDVMNRTTLSDTHELSTSNFIMSTRVRGVVRERAKSLGLGDANGEKGRNDEPSMTLPNLTLGDFDELMADSAGVAEEMKNTEENEVAAAASEVMDTGNASMTGDSTTSSLGLNGILGEDICATDEEKRKEGETGDLSFRLGSVNNGENTAAPVEEEAMDKEDVSMIEDSTSSSLGLNGILGLDTSKTDGERKEEAETVDLSIGLGSLNNVEKNENQESFVDSTASQSYLDQVLNNVGGGELEAEEQEQQQQHPPEDTMGNDPNEQCGATPNNSAILYTTLRQSPSFLSGKKKLSRKSVGGEDVAKIRAFTASVKKNKRDKSRTSLPNRAAKSIVAEKDVAVEDGGMESSRTFTSGVPKPSEKEITIALSSPNQVTSPSRLSKRDSPVCAVMDSPSRNTRRAKKSPAKSVDDEIMEFTSHQRSTPGKTREELAMLDDNSSTASSLGLNSILAHISDAEKSADKSGEVSLGPGSSKKQKPPKSPSKFDSPARNTGKSARVASPLDSPARNTRGAKASPAKSPSQLDSPARNTRSAKKSPAKSPSQMDSPARNTRSAKKSPSESSPARSLFTSPPSPSAFNQLECSTQRTSSPTQMTGAGPFSGRKRNASSADARKPLKKRASLSDFDAEPTDTMDCGTDTLKINQLIKDIQVDSSNSHESSGLSFSEDDSLRSANQNRNKRRQTADLNDLALIFGENADCHDNEEDNVTPPPTKLNTPKSILNSSKRKEKLRSNKKFVMFGSPETAIYNVGSPSTSFTPMAPKTAPQESDEVEKTTELEGDITQMIAKASDPSLMGPIDESCIESELPSDASSDDLGTSRQIMNGDRTEELETNIYSLVNNSGEVSEFSLPSVSEDSGNTANIAPSMDDKSAEESAMDVEETAALEATQTVALEGNLMSLLDAAPKDDAQTMEIEGTITSLLEKAYTNKNHQELPHKNPRESLPASFKLKATQESNFTYSTLTIPLDNDLKALVGGASQRRNTDDMHEPTHTMPLDSNLEDLLVGASSPGSENNGSIQFSKQHVSGEDDTVSELGMNTSQELSNNSDVQASLEKINEDEPLEPVDLNLAELVKFGEDDLRVGDADDVMVNSLEVASRNSFNSIKNQTEEILYQVCSDIESQISTIKVDAEFATALQEKEDAIRILQRDIRANDETTRKQVTQCLDAVHASTLSEWDSWLSQIADLYNDQLFDTAVGSLENDSVVIQNKSSDVDSNRDQVALPMLLRCASRRRKIQYKNKQADFVEMDAEVSQLESDLEKAEKQLEMLLKKNETINEISKSCAESESRSADVIRNRRCADSSFYKFFSIEKLHNWIITSSNESYIGLVFKGSASETNIHLSFWITQSSNTAFECKIGPLPRSVNALVGKQQVRYHPAVCSFLNSKMASLCHDLKENTRINSASKIPSIIQSVEHRLARIEQSAKEFDTILRQCKNSFLQPSDLTDGFDFHAYVKSTSQPGARIQVTLTLSECYPFSPIGVRLHSTDKSLDTEALARKLRRIIKPGFGALSKALDAFNSLLD